jgi:hypothetical protein
VYIISLSRLIENRMRLHSFQPSTDVVGRGFVRASAGFPLHTADFNLVELTIDDVHMVQMLWWLFKGYFFHVDIECVGTRAEIALMAQLVTRHIKETRGMPPVMRATWSYHQRRNVESAYARLLRLFETNSANEVEEDEAPAMRHLIFITSMQPLLHKLSDEAIYRIRQQLMHASGATVMAEGLSATKYGDGVHVVIHTRSWLRQFLQALFRVCHLFQGCSSLSSSWQRNKEDGGRRRRRTRSSSSTTAHYSSDTDIEPDEVDDDVVAVLSESPSPPPSTTAAAATSNNNAAHLKPRSSSSSS